jgi:hypothetical protein
VTGPRVLRLPTGGTSTILASDRDTGGAVFAAGESVVVRPPWRTPPPVRHGSSFAPDGVPDVVQQPAWRLLVWVHAHGRPASRARRGG